MPAFTGDVFRDLRTIYETKIKLCESITGHLAISKTALLEFGGQAFPIRLLEASGVEVDFLLPPNDRTGNSFFKLGLRLLDKSGNPLVHGKDMSALQTEFENDSSEVSIEHYPSDCVNYQLLAHPEMTPYLLNEALMDHTDLANLESVRRAKRNDWGVALHDNACGPLVSAVSLASPNLDHFKTEFAGMFT